VATISRLLKIIGLFCTILGLLQGSFAKETYNFKEPTNRSHPISAHHTPPCCRAFVRIYRALLQIYKALWRIYRALLRIYRALLRINRALSHSLQTPRRRVAGLLCKYIGLF